jgi:nucleoside-diphosphate-sugar epimerase
MTHDTALVTGYPNFVVTRLVRSLAESGRPVVVLCKEEFEAAARAELGPLGKLVSVLTGDVVCMDLGLSGPEVKRLRERTSLLFHMAGIYYLGSSEGETEQVNVEGTRNALAFAAELPGLQRFVHYSTAFVSGNREGVILEEELLEPHRFHNPFERTKFLAERIARQAMVELPISVVRPSLIVGDSETGEIDKLDGPYFFMHVLVNLPIDIHLPLVGKGAFPLNLVPVDFVARSMVRIASHPAAAGKTFHLVDTNPLSARKVFRLLCEAADKKPPRRTIPPNLATVLMKMPGLERHWRSPRLFIECLNRLVLYNAMNTTEILKGTDIVCPPFPAYVKNVVAFLRRRGQR